MTPYRCHYVCVNCRISLKLPADWTGKKLVEHRCLRCQGVLVNLGRKFKPPKKSDIRSWRVLKELVDAGWRGWGWPTRPSMSPREAELLTSLRREYISLGPKKKQSQIGRPRDPKTAYQQKRAAEQKANAAEREARAQEAYQRAELEKARRKQAGA